MCISFLSLLEIAGTEILSDYYRDAGTQLDKHDIKQVIDGIGDILRSYNIDTSLGVRLCQYGDTCGPQDLIYDYRCTLFNDITKQLYRYLKALICTNKESVRLQVSVCPYNNNAHLDKSGDHSCKGCTFYTQYRKRAYAEDQQPVQQCVGGYAA